MTTIERPEPGDRVELDAAHSPVRPGERGTIVNFDGPNLTIYVRWDGGAVMSLDLGADQWHYV